MKMNRAENTVPAVATVGAVKSVEHMDADLRIAILSCADVAMGITSRDRARAFVCVLSGYLAEIGESEIAEKMTVLLDGRGA